MYQMNGRVEARVDQQEAVRLLPDQVTRQLILVRGRSGPLTQDLDDGVVRNQAKFERGTDDYVAMVTAHQNTNIGLDAKVLGIREEVRKRCIVAVDGQETEFVEATPFVRNIWVGEHVKLLTPEEAAKTPYSGQTALYWAMGQGGVPEMIVRADNGYYYPATKDDIVMLDKS